MRLSLDSNAGAYSIRAYRSGAITVNDQDITHSVIVTPTQLLPWPPRRFAELRAEHFVVLEELKPEIVLLGTGARQQFPRPVLVRALIDHRIGLEVMDTGAACRTYSILVAEDRRVAAALLMI